MRKKLDKIFAFFICGMTVFSILVLGFVIYFIAPLHQQDSPAKGFLSVSYIQILGAAEFPASPVLCHSPSFDPIGLFSIVRVYSPTVKAGIYPLASVTS